jgi:hypothetical protein
LTLFPFHKRVVSAFGNGSPIFCRWLGRPLRHGDFAFVAPGMVVPPTLVEVLPMLLFYDAHVVGIARPLSLAEHGPHRILLIDKIGHDVKEVCGGLQLSMTEFMDKCFVGGAISEGTKYIGVGGIGKFIPLSGEPPDLILEGFPTLLGSLLMAP